MNLEYDPLEIQFQETIKITLSQSDEGSVWDSLLAIGALGYTVPVELGGYDLGETTNLLVCSELGRIGIVSPYIETITISDICQLDSINDRETLTSIVEGNHSYSLLYSRDLLKAEVLNNKLLISGELTSSLNIKELDFIYLLLSWENNSYVISVKKEQMLQKITPVDDKNTENIYIVNFSNFEINNYYEISESEVNFIYKNLLMRQAAYLQGLTEGALNETVEYTKIRRQFNSKLIDFQSIQFTLAEIFAELEAMKMKLNYTTWKLENNALSVIDSLETLALISEKALYASRKCIHYHGAYGMTKQAKISKYYTLVINEVNRYAKYKDLWKEISNLKKEQQISYQI
ncbi:acyl-CoA dehydrogenase family protein [Priestia megaterium]|uniref:acyl-CoA dehydrogenase family protein n=1 Tax=Priestia megaterium TaxID=1404 RepID=UPI0035D5FB86